MTHVKRKKCFHCGLPSYGYAHKNCIRGRHTKSKGKALKICIVCNKQYNSYHSNTRTCSHQCSNKHQWRRFKNANIKLHKQFNYIIFKIDREYIYYSVYITDLETIGDNITSIGQY